LDLHGGAPLGAALKGHLRRMRAKPMVVSIGFDCQVIGGKLQKTNMFVSGLDTKLVNTEGLAEVVLH
jgi:hypothetical protein